MTIWNEMKWLPYKLKYIQQNKLEPYIIDNMSDDGSWEWLQENNVPSHRFDTGGSFHLRKLQEEIIKTTHKIKPDWVVYNGCDLFPVTLNPLRDEIIKIDKAGFNTIRGKVIHLRNTGEKENQESPFHTYFYYRENRIRHPNKWIHKYIPSYSYGADQIKKMPNEKLFHLDGIMIEYGNTETAEERIKTVERRKKAWREGLPKSCGNHYRRVNPENWVKNKKNCIDIRTTEYEKYIKKLQKLVDD